MSRERFDLESSNLARTFTPVGSTTTPDMTSLCTSGRKLSAFENGPKVCSDAIQVAMHLPSEMEWILMK